MFYILLDEAQMAITEEEYNGKSMVKLYGILNSLLSHRNVDIYITGSNSKFLSSDILTEFRGRGDEIRVYHLSFDELYLVILVILIHDIVNILYMVVFHI